MPIRPEKVKPYINNQKDAHVLFVTPARATCGYYRLIWPQEVINSFELAASRHVLTPCLDVNYMNSILGVKVQYTPNNYYLKYYDVVCKHANESGFKTVFDIDDVLLSEHIPLFNTARESFVKNRNLIIESMNKFDEVTVVSDYMKDVIGSVINHKRISVIKNFVPRSWMGNFYDKQTAVNKYSLLLEGSTRPRVLWAPSASHLSLDGKHIDDASHVVDAIRKTVDEFEWIMFGAYPVGLKDLVLSGKIKHHPYVKVGEYPYKLKEIDPHFVIAPLLKNVFNEAKSDIKILESACYGVPTITQDLACYKDNYSDCKFTTGDELIDALRFNRTAAGTIDRLDERRAFAENRFLEKKENISQHLESVLTNFGTPRKFLL